MKPTKKSNPNHDQAAPSSNGSKRQKRRSGSRKRPGAAQSDFQIELLEKRELLAANVLISEFLASNNNGLTDGYGNATDWIELYNSGDMAQDLAGWHLTDNAANLNKWTFPSSAKSILNPGEYRVVFASGIGVSDPAGNLHTNFALSAAGEYLGLVKPDLSIVSEYGVGGTDFPPQFTDVSYGLEGTATVGNFIQYIDADEAPSGNTSGLLGGWVPRGAGAGEGSVNFANNGGALQANGTVSQIATTTTGLDSNQTYEVFAFFWDDNSNWNIQAGLTSGSLTNFTPATSGVFPINAATQAVGSNQRVTGLNVLGQTGDGNGYTDWIDGNRTLYAAPLGTITGQTSVNVYIDHLSTAGPRTWYDGIGIRGNGLVVDRGSAAQYWIPTNGNLGTTWTENNFNATANGFTNGFAAIGYENDLDGNPTSYLAEIETTVPAGTVSTYLRVPFTINNASSVNGLQLNVKYDDGFVAYLNGTKVASRNAPTTPVWNSSATTSHSDSEALVYETISLAGFENLLVDGQNTLAVQALNTGSSSTDYLFSPQLNFSTGGLSQRVRYFESPTPNATNNLGVEGFVADTNFSVKRGIYTAPFSVAITTATAGASIYYTTDGTVPSLSNPTATLYTTPLNITTNTNLRAAAFKDGFKQTNVDTQTYIFANDVLKQDPLNDNNLGVFPNNGQSYATILQAGVAGDYSIDDRANPASPTFDAVKFPNIVQSFSTLPTISLTLPNDQMFGSSGINTDATNENRRFGGSMEFFDPSNGDSFNVNVGIQAHGAASRDNVRLLKHSFRLIFSNEFDSPGTLKYPLFDNSDFADINTIVLRASFTDSFATRTATNRYSPLDSTYLRDVYMRDTQIAMGHGSADSTLAHLYINGLYWGVYSPTERVDDAFLASRYGGEREDWDIVRDFNELYRGDRIEYDQMMGLSRQINAATGSTANNLYQQIQGKNPDGTDNAGFPNLLDTDNFIDYMILHLYGSAEDWPSHNWVAARSDVNPEKGFRFFVWDQEIALDQTYRDKLGANNSNTPGELFQNLRKSSEFRLRFADRIQTHVFNDGALSTAAMQARWTQRMNQMAPAIVAESARWGDAREGQVVTAYTGTTGQIPNGSQTVPLMTAAHWQASMDFVNNTVFAQARTTFLSRATSGALFTSFAAPVFQINGGNQHGGLIAGGSSLAMTGAATLYYTLDGSDPRTTTGGVAGTVYSGPITLSKTTTVKARSFNGSTWSPVSEAVYSVAASSLVISEINYNPHAPTTAELAVNPLLVADDFDFVELLNASTSTAINLQGLKLANAVTYAFGAVNLNPGQRIVVVENLAAFQVRYGTSINVAGVWSGALSNGGENIQLLDALDTEIMSVNYNDTDPWYEITDGSGATLVLKDPVGTAIDRRGKYYSWRPSVEKGGTPGTAGIAPSGVVINEIRSHTDLPQRDAIELFNPTNAAINIGGWYLSDSGKNPLKYQIPTNTILGVGQYLVFDESHFNPTPTSPGPNDFGLNAALGDEVYLTRTAAGGQILYEDGVAFAATFNGDSLGRLPNGTGRLTRLTAGSFGSANTANAKVGPLVISEVNYHPDNPTAADLAIDSTLSDNDLEFIEINNPTGAPIDTLNWRIRGEVDFDFTVSDSIPAGGTWIVVPFNPTDPLNANKLLAFRNHYNIGTGVAIRGGFSGNLSNSYGRITLRQPDSPPISMPTVIPSVTVDEVVYDDLTPWANADGNGNSLHRAAATSNGNFASSWNGSTPTPGTANLAATAPQIAQTIRDGSPLNANGTPSGTPLVRPDLWATYSVRFGEAVNVTAGSLQLFSATQGGSAVSLTGIGFSYNSSNFTATWNLNTLATSLPAAFYDVVLNGSSITSISSGLALDGDGNGTAGGNYQQRIYQAIPGDANLDGDVDVSQFDFPANFGDLVTVKANLGTNSGATWAQGDFNGDGDVDVSQLVFPNNFGDLIILYANLGRDVKPPANISGGANLVVGNRGGRDIIGTFGNGGADEGSTTLVPVETERSDQDQIPNEVSVSGSDPVSIVPNFASQTVTSATTELSDSNNVESVSIVNIEVPFTTEQFFNDVQPVVVTPAETIVLPISRSESVSSESSESAEVAVAGMATGDVIPKTPVAPVVKPVIESVHEVERIENQVTARPSPELELVDESTTAVVNSAVAAARPAIAPKKLTLSRPLETYSPIQLPIQLPIQRVKAPIILPIDRHADRIDRARLVHTTTISNATMPLELGGSILVSFEKPLTHLTEPTAKTRLRDQIFAQPLETDSVLEILAAWDV